MRVAVAVAIIEKARQAAVATLDDVLGDVRKIESRLASHAIVWTPAPPAGNQRSGEVNLHPDADRFISAISG
jgi:hypothetical protein